MPVISVPTVQADTPASAPGNPHGKDVVTFRGQPYLGKTSIVTSTVFQQQAASVVPAGEVNGEVYLDKIEIMTNVAGQVFLTSLIGATFGGEADVLQPLNTAQSSGPAWIQNGLVSGDISFQQYAEYRMTANQLIVFEPTYPVLLSQSIPFSVYTTGVVRTLNLNFYVRIVV